MAFDPPTAADRRRLRKARATARGSIEIVEATRRRAQRLVFQGELGETIRSASPFLIALLRQDGLQLDDVVELIDPAAGWPRRPRLSMGGVAGPEGARHLYRYYLAGQKNDIGKRHPSRDLPHGMTLLLRCGNQARVEAMGHSLEVAVKIGSVRMDTRFGVLRVELEDTLPETLWLGMIGRPIREIVDHPALRCPSWKITEVEETGYPFHNRVLVVPIGATTYRMPWARDVSKR